MHDIYIYIIYIYICFSHGTQEPTRRRNRVMIRYSIKSPLATRSASFLQTPTLSSSLKV